MKGRHVDLSTKHNALGGALSGQTSGLINNTTGVTGISNRDWTNESGLNQ